MVTLCLRLDDVHGRTPLTALRALDDRVWAGRPVVLGTIPFPALGCLGPVASPREVAAARSTATHPGLLDYLDGRRAEGLAEVALHGLTHADHRSPAGPAVAELVAPSAGRVTRLTDCLHGWRSRFGTRTLIPPHNYIDPGLREQCLAEGFHVSRAVTDAEVSALGLDPDRPDHRAEAKRRRPYRLVGTALDVYQTTGVSYERVRRAGPPAEELAESVMAIAAPTGIGVITFHWWDFVRADASWCEEFAQYTTRLLRRCEALAPVEFSTVADLADDLVAAAQRRPKDRTA
ncbi:MULTISPECIES: hypothetical protein [unclassified Kitasatospora]|uniref:hypothetical protein n=1 Tax=unclassified Kitasatospora TaxID=2633591 RepID=UPI001ADFFAE2|nr:hypothetical protein [Kitasatospora sp. RG8]MBP0451130.1 hypothetical protein [Kitasatospora sp. RG8]